MADKKISALTAASTPLAGTEVLPIVQSSSTVKVAVSNLTAGRNVSASGVTVTAGGSVRSYRPDGAIYTDQYMAAGAGGGYIFNNANSDGFKWQFGGVDQFTIDVNGNFVQKVAAKGVNFTANTPAAGMTSQLLNWYEEGTFTPLISDGTNNATNIPQVGGSYTRIGRLVVITGTVGTSSLGSVTGNIRLTGFPYATPTQFYAQSAGAVSGTSGLNITAGQSVSLLMDRTAAFAYIMISDAATGTSNMTATQWSADGAMSFCVSYVVA